MIALGSSMVISMTWLEAEDSIKSSTATQWKTSSQTQEVWETFLWERNLGQLAYLSKAV